MDKDEQCAEAHYFAGIVFQRWSDDEQAYEHYMQAFEQESDNVQYLLASAESLVALGEFGAARELVEPKLSYFEYNSALQHLLGQIALLEGDVQEAATRYAEARMLDPENEGRWPRSWRGCNLTPNSTAKAWRLRVISSRVPRLGGRTCFISKRVA